MKKIMALMMVATLVFSFPTTSFSEHTGGQCPHRMHAMMSKKFGHGHDKYACPITAKLMHKGHFFLSHQKELGLSDQQVQSIKELKLSTKKAYIQQKAQHKIFALDIEHKLSEPTVDVKGIEGMIDKMSASMAASAKETVTSFAKLKSILTEEQRQKAKDLWLQEKTSTGRQS